jgi:acyl carrier protein
VVLDDELRAVAYGEVGELCLGGAGVARGYRNNEQQTAERFVQHPEHGRIYRTGDLVRQDAQGNLVYLGRRDTQVKVRGHRIELEQIETRLAELLGVREAVCAVQGEGSRKSIVGFVVPSDPAAPPDLEALRNQLVVLLPAPMVPTKFGLLEALPKSVGGKLDRKRLPKLELSSRLDNTEELEGMAAILAGRFAKVLGFTSEGGTTSGVGLDSDFFLELGGDSLAAAELVSLLREDPRTEAITVRDLYAVRTVRGLVPLCRDTAPHAASSASQVAEQPPRYGEPKGSPVWFTVAQTAWILAELALISALLFENPAGR